MKLIIFSYSSSFIGSLLGFVTYSSGEGAGAEGVGSFLLGGLILTLGCILGLLSGLIATAYYEGTKKLYGLYAALFSIGLYIGATEALSM